MSHACRRSSDTRCDFTYASQWTPVCYHLCPLSLQHFHAEAGSPMSGGSLLGTEILPPLNAAGPQFQNQDTELLPKCLWFHSNAQTFLSLLS